MENFTVTCTPGRESAERGKLFNVVLDSKDSENKTTQQWRGVITDSTNYFKSPSDAAEFVQKNGKFSIDERNATLADLVLPMSTIRLRCGDAMQKQPSFGIMRLDARHRQSRVVFSVGSMFSNTGGFVPLLYNFNPRKFVVNKISIPDDFEVVLRLVSSTPNQPTPSSTILNFDESFEFAPYQELVCEFSFKQPGVGFVMVKAL